MNAFRLSIAGCAMISALASGACAGLVKTGKVTHYASPHIDATRFKTITVIAESETKHDLQIMGRVRDRIAKAGVNVVKRTGRWENERQMVQDLCTKRPDAFDNVDGVVLTRWDRVILHDCASGNIALEVNGGYSGTDAITDRLLQYLGAASSASK